MIAIHELKVLWTFHSFESTRMKTSVFINFFIFLGQVIQQQIEPYDRQVPA
jgi:hypothetical protein